MQNTNRSSPHLISQSSAVKPMLIGAAIALIPTLFFLMNAGAPDPAWPKFWMVRPAIIIPFAGAMGGLFYFLTKGFRDQGGWKQNLAILISVVVYLVGLWMGIVLGLDGTLWD